MGRPIPQAPRIKVYSAAPVSPPPSLFWVAILLGVLFAVIASLMAGCSQKPAVSLPAQQDVVQVIDWADLQHQAVVLPSGKIVHMSVAGGQDGGRYEAILSTSRDPSILVWPDAIRWSEGNVPHLAKPEPELIVCINAHGTYYCNWFNMERF